MVMELYLMNKEELDILDNGVMEIWMDMAKDIILMVELCMREIQKMVFVMDMVLHIKQMAKKLMRENGKMI